MTPMGFPCYRQPLSRGLISVALIAFLFLAPAATASEVVLLDFVGGGGGSAGEMGTPRPFAESVLVQRIAADLGQGAAAVAAMMQADIQTGLENAYSGKWIRFTTTAGDPDITRTIDFPASVTAGYLGATFKNGTKAWVLPDEFDVKVWVPPNTVGGGPAKPAADRKLDKAEATNALIKTAAHELGHMLMLEHMHGEKITQSGEAAGKPLVLNPPNPAIGLVGSHIMAQGISIFGLDFKPASMKFLEKKIGTTDDFLAHVFPFPFWAIVFGDHDDYGNNPDQLEKDTIFFETLDPNDISVDPGDDPWTDVLLPAGTTSYAIALPSESSKRVESAFMEVALYGVDNIGNPGSVTLAFDGVNVSGELATLDQSPDPGDPTPSGSQFTKVLIDLVDEGLSRTQLESMFSDGQVSVELTVADGFGETVAVDQISIVVFHSADWQAQLTVPAGINPDDLHLLFTGTGGTIVISAVVPAPAAVASPGGTDIDVKWGAPLAPGTVVTVHFTTTFSPVQFNSGNWTVGGANVGAIAPGDVTLQPVKVPTLSQWGMIVLVVLLLVAGAVFIVRRRPDGAVA